MISTLRRLRPLRTAGWLALWLCASAAPSHAARPRIYAITDATVIPSAGQRIEGGTVVLRDGLVDSVGRRVTAPDDAVLIDGKGLYVYPGLIDAGGWSPSAETPAAQAGAAARSRTAPREAEPGPLYPIGAIRPERRVADLLQAFEGDRRREAESLRRLGFVAVLAAPSKGILRGSGALVLLREDASVADLIVRDGVSQHLAFETGGFGDPYPNSLMGAAAAVRQTLADARRYAVWTERYDRNPSGMPRPERLPSMEALRPVLSGRQPLFLAASAADDILLADRIAREFDVPLVAVASGTEAEIADQIARTKRTIVYPVRFPDKPKVDDPDEALDVSLKELRRYVDAAAAPKVLAAAGVPLALTAHGLKNTADFTSNVRSIIEAGWSEEAALAALTSTPSALLGVDRAMGSIEPGKIANIVVADGPLFAKGTKIRRVFVDGVDYPIEEKAKPKGDPSAVVDPRGTWSVVIELGQQTIQRTWTITGERGRYAGTAETRSAVVTFEKVELEGNAMTVVFPPSEGRGSNEVTVIIQGEAFEGTIEMGSRSAPVKGTRTRGPEGSAP